MKKLYSIYILPLLLAVILLVACSDEKKDSSQSGTPAITWVGGQTSPVFDVEGGSVAVLFSSAADWTAEVDQSWCSVSPARGVASTDCEVIVTTEANDTPDERNATLILRSGTVMERLTIVQKQKDALTVTSNRIEAPGEGGEVVVEVKANIDFTYTVDEAAAEWLKPVETRALTTTRLHFSVAANDSGEKREGKIVIQNGQLSETVTVYQDNFVPELVLTKDEYTVSSEGEILTIEIRSNVDYEMRLPADVDWISEASTRAVSTYTHYIQVSPNENYDSRSVKIPFVSEELELADTVTIIQVQKDAIIVAQSTYVVAPEGGSLDFAVNTNVEFEVSLSADWIHQIPDTRALEEIPVSFTVEANAGSEPREAIITFISANVEQTVTVRQLFVQEEQILGITYTGCEFTIPAFAGTYFSGIEIAWGDGKTEVYKDEAKHTYADEGTYDISIRSQGAETFTLQNLTGVSEVDLTGF